MKSVDPIRDMKKVDSMKKYLKGKDIRDYTMFVLGINIALRISDLLKLKWSDVLKNKKSFKDIFIIEVKTKKQRKIKLNKASRKALRELGHLFH
ncbi:MAG: tyrosine-type recombinase/integrase [Mammaliicoccus vitulinus]